MHTKAFVYIYTYACTGLYKISLKRSDRRLRMQVSSTTEAFPTLRSIGYTLRGQKQRTQTNASNFPPYEYAREPSINV